MEKYRHWPIQDMDDPVAFDLLDEEDQGLLLAWIRASYWPTEKTFYMWKTSYGLKQPFHEPHGFWVSNGIFKQAMLLCGFKVLYKSDRNWIFNISKRSPIWRRDRR